MIITAGSLKFKKVKTLENIVFRPTSNKIRQAIFNILIHKLEFDKWKNKNHMLDAFAGTGIISFEAISRGLLHSTLIEQNIEIYNALLENIKNLNINNNNTYVVNNNFFDIKKLPYKYKLIYLDPPYNQGLLNPAIELINDLKLFKKNSFLICETEKNFEINSVFRKYIKYEKTYRNIKVLFLVLN